MYKIQFLFVMLLWCTGVMHAQQPGQRRSYPTQQSPKTNTLRSLLGDPTTTAQNHRPAVFTDHQLADWVDLSKKHAFDALTGGQQASLSCPILCQTLFR